MIKVVKFGGSSLADAQQFAKVKDIIMADSSRIYVVPSAPGKRSYTDEKITDLLYNAQKAASNGEDIEPFFSTIEKRYIEIKKSLHLKVDIEEHLNIVKSNILNGASADYAASRGEYLNGLLLADFLGYDFIDAANLIRFKASGEYDPEATQQLCGANIFGHSNAVIPGFYGATEDGSIKTFSRGGSDITGAIIARGTNADLYENWTDVSGFLMADPRIVQNPRSIKTVTYTELRELSYMGATVLHEEAIFPVRQACIPINVKNTNAPQDPGTMIVPDVSLLDDGCPITGVAGKKGFTIIALEKDQMNTCIGFAACVLNVLAKHGVSIEHMPTGIDTLSVIVFTSQLEGKRERVIDDIMNVCMPDSLEVTDNLALLAVVGHGMINRIGTSAAIFKALANSGVNVRMIDQGSSELNIIVGVEDDQFKTAVVAIYNEFAGQ